MSNSETIYALSSGIGRAGVAIIRISGPKAGDSYSRLTDTDSAKLPAARTATLAELKHPQTNKKLDQALTLYFPAPASFTGEHCLELHVHGGRAVVTSVLDALGSIDGLRPAEPGEFTRRAFENGKMDLTEAEGLNDLIHADTSLQQAQALAQADGKSGERLEQWRRNLISLMARIEADLDFSDEDDVPDDVATSLNSEVEMLRSEFRHHLDNALRGEIIRDGFQVVLAGAPNVGKSSVLNAIAKRDVAIVSDEAGTTRDMIEVHLDLDGIPVTLSDTAGLREAESKIEQEGIRRSRAALDRAHLVLWITDVTATGNADRPAHRCVIQVLNKIDQLRAAPPLDETIPVSATAGTNLDELIDRIAAAASAHLDTGEPALVTRARHRHLLEAATTALTNYSDGDPAALELRAEDLRTAATKIGQITGRVDVEDVLDEIFSAFCIGK